MFTVLSERYHWQRAVLWIRGDPGTALPRNSALVDRDNRCCPRRRKPNHLGIHVRRRQHSFWISTQHDCETFEAFSERKAWYFTWKTATAVQRSRIKSKLEVYLGLITSRCLVKEGWPDTRERWKSSLRYTPSLSHLLRVFTVIPEVNKDYYKYDKENWFHLFPSTNYGCYHSCSRHECH